MEFEDLPTTPTAEELLDQAFSRGARAGRAKQGIDAQTSMVRTATNVVHDNLRNVVTSWPDTRALDPFYRELAGAVLRRTWDADGEDKAGVNALRQHLSTVSWAADTAKELGREYESRVAGADDAETARKHREQAYARLADVVEQAGTALAAVGEARTALVDLPDIRPDEPAIVVAGVPNVGKSTLVNAVTRADNETATYPFTTTRVAVGHLERDHIRYQLVDTPGLLDRPAAERNDVEAQAVSALENVADAVLFLLDASGASGYPLADQLALRDELAARFDGPVVTVRTRADRDGEGGPPPDHDQGQDRDTDLEAVVDGRACLVPPGEAATETPLADDILGPEAVVDLAVAAVGYEPELPYEG